MSDPRREAIFVKKNGRFEPANVASLKRSVDRDGVDVVFVGNPEIYPYSSRNVTFVRELRRVSVPEGHRVDVRGSVWESVIEVWAFPGPYGDQWRRIFYHTKYGEKCHTCPALDVRIVPNAATNPAVADVLGYFQCVVSRRDNDDPLRKPYDALQFVHPESALASYLTGAPIVPRLWSRPRVFPFRCNISQREAVWSALTHSVSVIEGPPGTGKTETILNVIANVIVAGAGTVGVVSSNNAAVANVRQKLDDQGFGHVVANLGKRDNQEEFFAQQATRNERVAAAQRAIPAAPDLARITEMDRRIEQLQVDDRERAEVRALLAAHRLELRHFEGHRERQEEPDLERLPLLRRSSQRIVDFLVESEVEHRDGRRPGLVRRVRKYFRYGSLRGLDPDDADVIVRLQRAYYDKRITELDQRLGRLDERLREADFDRLVEVHRQLSVDALRAALGARYSSIPRQRTYSNDSYRRGREFQDFTRDYPVLLSTCHSLPRSLADGYLLDYLVIDEASQVDLPLAALAMSCCRNLVVVGDQRQLPPIVDESLGALDPPVDAYDHRKSILASLGEIYGDRLPSTLLREHYRCAPAIIGFCNKTYYGGDLIPFTSEGTDRSPMFVLRTVAGNHMRQHREGGRSNQRELDAIRDEVLEHMTTGFTRSEIGVVTPYRRQADRAADTLIDVEADTVHRYQGRQIPVVAFSTVLSENWRGWTGLPFVDDPQKINVAVSRAIKKFVVVTNNDLMPTSRNIRDLIEYIGYHNPDEEVVDSAVVSVFDLLYRTYDKRLEELAGRLRSGWRFRSEAIVATVVDDVLQERGDARLTVVPHVQLRNLFPDPSGLTERQEAFVRHRASVDFVVYSRVSNEPLLAVEVDGFAFHENNPKQRERDVVKDEIFRVRDMPLERLATTGSGEYERLRRALDRAEEAAARRAQRRWSVRDGAASGA